MQVQLETIVCKFGGDPAICLREEAICTNVYRWTDGQMDATRRHYGFKTLHVCVAGLYPLVGWKFKDELVYIAEGFASDTGRCLEWASSIGECSVIAAGHGHCKCHTYSTGPTITHNLIYLVHFASRSVGGPVTQLLWNLIVCSSF